MASSAWTGTSPTVSGTRSRSDGSTATPVVTDAVGASVDAGVGVGVAVGGGGLGDGRGGMHAVSATMVRAMSAYPDLVT